MTTIFYMVVETTGMPSFNLPVWHERIEPVLIQIESSNGDTWSAYGRPSRWIHNLSTKVNKVSPGACNSAELSSKQLRDAAAVWVNEKAGSTQAVIITPRAYYTKAIYHEQPWEWFCMLTANRTNYKYREREIDPRDKPFALKNVFAREMPKDIANTIINKTEMMKIIYSIGLRPDLKPFDSQNPAMVYKYINPDDSKNTSKHKLVAKLITEARAINLYKKMLEEMRGCKDWVMPAMFGFTVLDLMAWVQFRLNNEEVTEDLEQYKAICKHTELILRTQIFENTNAKSPKPNHVYSDKQIADVLCAITDLEPHELIQKNLMYNFSGTPISYLPVKVSAAQAERLEAAGFRSIYDIYIDVSTEQDDDKKIERINHINETVGVLLWYQNYALDVLEDFKKSLVAYS